MSTCVFVVTCAAFLLSGMVEAQVIQEVSNADFIVQDPAGSSSALKRYNGEIVVYDGFYLASLLNGDYGGKITTDYENNLSLGLGVDEIGFTRSVNNDGLTSEALELYISPDAARGAYAGLVSVEMAGGASTVLISGFASDPLASSSNGSTIYDSGVVTWVQSSAGGKVTFANPSAIPVGSRLVFSNGSTNGAANQFGFLGFSYTAAEKPPCGIAAIHPLGGDETSISWYATLDEAYRLQYRNGFANGAWSNLSERIRGGSTAAVTTSTVSATSFYRVVPDDAGMILGANVNAGGTALEVPLLEQSRSEWIRVFFPVKKFLNGSRILSNDPDLDAVKEAVLSGRKLVLCLKLNFDTDTYRVPEPDTAYEAETFQWVEDLMEELSGMVSVFETVNEVMVDTQADDLQSNTNGIIPMVRYLQRLVDYIEPLGYVTPEGDPLPVYSGGFTRLYDANMQVRPAVPALLSWIQSDARIAGVNFHIHADDIDRFRQSYDFLRSAVPEKPSVVTEFSLVWKYKNNISNPFDEWPEGVAFANNYGYNSSMIVRDYINFAITNSVSEAEWNDFLEQIPWYDTGFLGQACTIMETNGTVLATFAFQQASSGGKVLQPGDNPWILNPIFANVVATNGLSSAAVNGGFFGDYISW